ncbi:rRNA cytosine-C5-methylase [uncultured Alistipes sp.]|uniref:methyltransferase RsmF C-terminal domain-like protein n=1 Tax=uncultured Alistipes sp. TaxID=538949 RepID=UPI001FA683B9|nr:rRNA cytosine-C5-methylase [uncultured Alistipes sp.]HIX97391.1 rRNA cytosine-C5-methylase [Candidatus Alistipes avistercoris]
MELPRTFVERVLRDLGTTEGEALCRALDGEACVSIRVNPAKAEGLRGEQPARVSEVLPMLTAAGRVPWCADGFLLAGRPSFTFDSDFHAGAYYVQEAASQFVGCLLQGVPTSGARILDLCAAPGGKTTLYASLVGRGGLVVANEIDRRRASVLADNVRKWGTGNVVVTTCEPHAVCDCEAWFDVVAVDAPCSGEGMFRKDPAARGEWSENNVRQCAARQDDILREAWRALRPGGTLIYSTCTFNRDEDEGSLERMLAWAGDEVAASEPVDVDPAWGIVEGEVGPFRTFRFFPHRTVGEGFFAAVARKAPDAPGRQRLPKGRRSMVAPADRASAGELRRWVREPDRMVFGTVAGTGYAWYGEQAEAVKTLSEALPVICSGVALGQLFKGRLKPDPALAFFDGLERGAVPVAGLDDEQALRYLRRQEVAAGALAEGVNLVTARGRALGFAKRIGARVNNMYPNSLRILRQE